MMRILGTGLPVPLWRRAFRAPEAETPKPSRNAESETKAKTKQLEKVERKRSRPNAADEPPRTWRVPYTVGGESTLPWFVTPL